MTEKWVMIVWLSAGFYIPVGAFDTENDCYAAIDYAESGIKITCVRGIVEPEKKKRGSKRLR